MSRIVLVLCVLLAVSAASAQSTDAQKLAALADAYKNGILTKQEYDAKVAQIKGAAVDPKKKAALDDARKAGILTQQEYDAKLQALKSGANPAPVQPAPTAPPTQTAVAPPSRGGKKTVTVVDSVFRNMPAYTVTIPADWVFDGAVLRPSCGDDLPFLVFRAYSLDRQTGVQWLPRADWYSAANPQAYQMAGVAPCNLHAPARAADAAPAIATGLRAGSQVLTTAPPPADEAATFQRNLDSMNAMLQQNSARTPGFLTKLSGDKVRVRLRYDFEGHPEEEWLSVAIRVADQPVSVAGTDRNGIIQPGVARLLHSSIFTTGMRAPAGKLDSTEAMMREIMLSVKIIPEYDEAYVAYMKGQSEKAIAALVKAGQATLESGRQAGEALKRQNDQFHAWQAETRAHNQQKFAQDMQRKDSQAANFLDYVKDQTYYVNPSTGGTVTIQNSPGINGYYGQNPSGGWTQLVPISH